MKKIAVLSIILIVANLSFSQQEILCKHFSPHSSGRGAGGEAILADSLRSDTIDILKTTINLQITDFSGKTISGNSQIDFAPKMNGISTLSMDLLKFIVDSVQINNSNLSYSYNDTLLIATLPSVKNIGDTTSITVFYHGAPVIDASNWGGFYFTATEAYNLGVGFAAVPHNYGRVWFPCFDNFVERCKYEFNIKTNGGKIAYCNGTLTKDTTDVNGFRTRTFVLNETIPSYLAMVAVGNYTQLNWSFVSISGDTIPLILSDIATDTTKLKNSFVNLKNGIAGFENRYGAYPWKKAGYAVVPFNAGAMEHATNITYPRPFVQGNTNYEDQLMAHEFSHQWWGDHITCNYAGEMWINEGMATYSQFIFNEWIYGMSKYKSNVRANHDGIVHYANYKEGGYLAIASVPDQYTYGDHSYLKGADVAHTMRGYLGDSLFFAGLKYVQSNNPFTDVSSAKFRDDMSFATGVNMNDFFTGWVFNGGWPHFSIDSFSSAPNGGNYDVTVYVIQKLHGAPNFFSNVPLEISFKDAGWNEAVKTINVSGQTTTATVTLPFNPIFAGMDLDEKISDAITQDMKVVKAAGTSFNTISNGRLQLTVQSITPNDSALILIEHNWAPPDSFKVPNPNYKISPYHYWKVSGILPPLFDATASVMYDGRICTSGGGCYLDHQLITATNQEDSIVLLYRKNTADDWSLFPYTTKVLGPLTDKNGTIKIDSLLLGEYAIAFAYVLNNSVLENEISNSIAVFPNPSTGAFTVQSSKLKIKNSEILDVTGRIIKSAVLENGILNLHGAESGIYFLKIKTEKGTAVKKLIKQ